MQSHRVMISIILFSCIIAQTIVAIYLFNTLKLKDDFEKNLNIALVILFFHLGTKIFLLVIVKDFFLFNNNATGFGLSYGPLLYFTARLYLQQAPGKRTVLLHLIPFLVFTLLYFINCTGHIFHIIPADYINSYTSVYQWLVAASMVVYPVITYKLLKRYIVGLGSTADPKVKLLHSMGFVMITGVVLGLLSLAVSYIIKGYHDFDLRLLPYTCLAVIPVLILQYKMQPDTSSFPGVAGTEQTPEEEYEVPSEKRYKKSSVDSSLMNEYEVGLAKFMAKSKIYLEAEVSLEELAEKAKIPKHHLTQLLNERIGKNFYTFINEYRINEAIERLKNSEAGSGILSLAYDCGFNSKSSFNSHFKKVTGLTPSAYRKEMSLQSAGQETLLQ